MAEAIGSIFDNSPLGFAAMVIHDPSNAASRVAFQGLPFLDAVTVKFGPCDELARFFLVANAVAFMAGVAIRIHDDLNLLVRANAEYPEGSWGPIAPAFDPAESDLTPTNAFWVSVHDLQTTTLVACACSRLLTPPGPFSDEFTSLRLFYAEPTPHLQKGTTCEPAGNALVDTRSMSGRIIYSGAQWTHKDFRSRGIVYVLTRIIRLLGLTRWDADYSAALTRADLSGLGRLEPYGFKHSAKPINFLNSYRGDMSLSIMWLTRAEMIEDMRDYVRKHEGKIALVTEAVDTVGPSLPRQGSNSRW